jgi:hypothetical protein
MIWSYKHQNIISNWMSSERVANYYRPSMNNSQTKAKLYIFLLIVLSNFKSMNNAKILLKNIRMDKRISRINRSKRPWINLLHNSIKLKFKIKEICKHKEWNKLDNIMKAIIWRTKMIGWMLKIKIEIDHYTSRINLLLLKK